MIRRGDQSPAFYDALSHMLIRSWFSLNHAPEGASIRPLLCDAGDRYTVKMNVRRIFLLTASDLIETGLSNSFVSFSF